MSIVTEGYGQILRFQIIQSPYLVRKRNIGRRPGVRGASNDVTWFAFATLQSPHGPSDPYVCFNPGMLRNVAVAG